VALEMGALVAIFGEGIQIVLFDDMPKNFGTLPNTDNKHYCLDCFGLLAWRGIYPSLLQVHGILRATYLHENTWPCVNKQTKIIIRYKSK